MTEFDKLAAEPGDAFLREIGYALFGEHWQKPLGDHLGVSNRNMRRWAKNPYLIPDAVLMELSQVATHRGAVLLRAHRRLLREVTRRSMPAA